MENPYIQSHMAVAAGLSGAARHSPNRAALATRKVCQNDEIPERQASVAVPAKPSDGPCVAMVNADPVH
jgi:hypothetical protein